MVSSSGTSAGKGDTDARVIAAINSLISDFARFEALQVRLRNIRMDLDSGCEYSSFLQIWNRLIFVLLMYVQ